MFEFARVGCELKSSHDILSLPDVRICRGRLRTQEFTRHYISYMMFQFARVGCELKTSHDIISLRDVQIWTGRLRSQEFRFEHIILVYDVFVINTQRFERFLGAGAVQAPRTYSTVQVV